MEEAKALLGTLREALYSPVVPSSFKYLSPLPVALMLPKSQLSQGACCSPSLCLNSPLPPSIKPLILASRTGAPLAYLSSYWLGSLGIFSPELMAGSVNAAVHHYSHGI